MVKGHSDSQRGNLLPPQHGLFFSLLYHIPRHGALNGTRNNSKGPPSGIDPTAYRTMKSADIRGIGPQGAL